MNAACGGRILEKSRAWPWGCALGLMKNVECIMKNSVGSLYSNITLKNINCNCVIKKSVFLQRQFPPRYKT